MVGLRSPIFPLTVSAPEGFRAATPWWALTGCSARWTRAAPWGLRQLRQLSQEHPRVWPCGRLLVIDVGSHRQADEQGLFVGVVVGQFDADGQPLDDLDEVARGVLRRQQGQGLAGPHGEAGDPAFELQPAAVHINLAACPLADAEVGQLRFLEIGVDPDLRERADGHETLPHLDVVAGVDVAAGHHAVDIADDAAVAEIQFGLVQVAAGLVDLGLGLLDGGRLGNELGEDAVEVALGILLVELRDGLFWGRGPRGRKVTELGRALQQFAQCLTNGGKVLVQIGRHLLQLLPRRRHRGEAEAGSYGIDRLQGLFDARLGDRVRFPKHVEILNGDGRRRATSRPVGDWLWPVAWSPSGYRESPRRRAGWRSGCPRPRWHVGV